MAANGLHLISKWRDDEFPLRTCWSILTVCLFPVFLPISSCQFVVSEDQDYTAHFADPDTLVNWDFVEQVVSSLVKLISS